MSELIVAKEQFAGHAYYDNYAVCLTCGHKHMIGQGERVQARPWLDWLTKHAGHETAILSEQALREVDLLLERLAHNADAKVSYVASAAYTITLTGLASDTNLLAGREGTGLSNSSNKYLDVLISGLVTTGTSPTASRQIELHVVGSLNDTPLYPDVFDGTDSAETITSSDIKAAICKLAGFSTTSNTNDRTYPFAPQGIRALFGADALPNAHVPFVVHNTGVNLNATAANHAIYHTQCYATIA